MRAMLSFACAISAWGFAAQASAGSGPVTFEGFYAQAILRQADGKLLVAGGARNRAGGLDFAVARLNADDSADTSFNSSGFTRAPVWGDYEWASLIAVHADGKLVIAGTVADPAGCPCPIGQCVFPPCGANPAIIQLNSDGTIDRSFHGGEPLVLVLDDLGGGGGDELAYTMMTEVKPEADGGLVLFVATATDDGWTAQSPAARVRRDGTVDATFATESFAAHVATFAPVIEFYSRSLDHYFMTAFRGEFEALDEGRFGDWARTHKAFHAWRAGSANGTPVCRLHGAASGLESHFFSTDSAVCQGSALGDAWTLESADAFRVDAPASSSGDCSDGDLPLYRLSNQRRDLNYRFTPNPNLADEMVARGYAPAGSGPRGVFACVPA